MNLAHHHNTMILFYNNVLLAVLELVAAHMMLIPDSTQFVDAPEDTLSIPSQESAMLAAHQLNTTIHSSENAKTALLSLLAADSMMMVSLLFAVANLDTPKMMSTWSAISVLLPNTMTLTSENVLPAQDKLHAADSETEYCQFADAQEDTLLILLTNGAMNHVLLPNTTTPHNCLVWLAHMTPPAATLFQEF